MKFTFTTLATLIAFASFAQNGLQYSTQSLSVPLAKTIDFGASIADYDPKILLLKSTAPAPLSEAKKNKLLLDQQRKFRTKPKSLDKKAAPAPLVVTGFSGNTTQSTPNDNDLAISNAGMIVSVVNSNFNVYDSTGKYLFGRSLSAFANVLGALNRTFDPRVVYDPVEDRFIIVFLQGSTSADTRIIVAFSQENDPTKKWNFYVLPGNVTGDASWSDYPILSLSKDELFVTVNRVKDNTPWQTGFVTSYIWQCDKKAGYAGNDTINPKLYHDISYNGQSIWNVCPVKGGSTLYGPKMFFLSQRPSDLQNDTLFLHELTNTNASGNATLKTTVLRTNTTYGLQPNAIQPNGKRLQTNDARILSACYENGFIHYVGNTIDTALFVPAVYYGRVYGVYGNNPTVEGKIISYDSMDIGYPSISYIGGGEGDNSMLITFSHVSPTQFPGTSVVFADRAGNLSAPVFAKKGEGNIAVIGDSIERWGDYTGNQRKYNEPGVCWVNGSWGSNTGGNKTWIAKIKTTDPTLATKQIDPTITQTILYPNPTASVFTLEFSIAQTQKLSFDIIDITGKRVVTLLNEYVKAGLNQFSFTTNDLANGTYFLIIKHENKIIQQEKIVVSH